jgi:hypothetical protein
MFIEGKASIVLEHDSAVLANWQIGNPKSYCYTQWDLTESVVLFVPWT